MNKKDLKRIFRQDFNKAQELVNDLDPCGLIYSGAPADEYDCLTNLLLSAIYNGKARTEIKELVLTEIEEHFGTPDLETMTEPVKIKLFNDIEILIDKLEQYFERSQGSN